MHIVDFQNPPNDTKRIFGIWGKLLIGFWPIMSCSSFESFQTSMKGVKSKKKHISGVSLPMHFEHLQ